MCKSNDINDNLLKGKFNYMRYSKTGVTEIRKVLIKFS